LAFEAWASGRQAAILRLNRQTQYRYRKALINLVGIDILVPRPVGHVPDLDIELRPENWDPEPLSEFLFTPDPLVSGGYRDPV
jgi:hypothetical protein